jgi:pyridoxine 5-phosphate synthase
MLKLGVNIDHVATLREARYRGRRQGEPDPVEAALMCESAGAHGITAHLREDRRHIQDRDVWKLREQLKTRLNLEMANTPEILALALKLKPDIVCLVPERRQELTTEGGLDVAGSVAGLTEARHRLNDAGIEVSLFIAPDPVQIDAAARVGSQFVELHTGAFAENFSESRGGAADHRAVAEDRPAELAEQQRRELASSLQSGLELERLVSGAQRARKLGLKVNAGHGLNYHNLPTLLNVPHLLELNIGHSIISRAMSVGLNSAVKEMLALMIDYDSGRGH